MVVYVCIYVCMCAYVCVCVRMCVLAQRKVVFVVCVGGRCFWVCA